MKASKDELSLNITEHVHWLKDVINKYLTTGKVLSADFSELPYLADDDLTVLPDARLRFLNFHNFFTNQIASDEKKYIITI